MYYILVYDTDAYHLPQADESVHTDYVSWCLDSITNIEDSGGGSWDIDSGHTSILLVRYCLCGANGSDEPRNNVILVFCIFILLSYMLLIVTYRNTLIFKLNIETSYIYLVQIDIILHMCWKCVIYCGINLY